MLSSPVQRTSLSLTSIFFTGQVKTAALSIEPGETKPTAGAISPEYLASGDTEAFKFLTDSDIMGLHRTCEEIAGEHRSAAATGGV
jgi:hypothetical protein